MTNNIIKTRKVGGSVVITISKSIVEKSNMKIGDYYGYSFENGKIIFSPAQIVIQ